MDPPKPVPNNEEQGLIQKIYEAILKIGIKLLPNVTEEMIIKAIAAYLKEELPKIIAKQTTKEVPVVGFLMGCGFGAWRLVNGEFVEAGAELTSGIASTFPGAGTLISLGIDITLLASDIIKVLREERLI